MRTLIAGILLVLAGCSGTGAAPRPSSTVPVIAPGKPGEAARTLSPGEAATAVPSPTANAADVKYVQDMVVHHRQALDMCVLAPSRASFERVKAIASRIKDTQAPEIEYLATWLREQGQRVPGHHAAHTGMPGMATPEQMEALKAASGAAFDRLFLELMIRHHEGAVRMSADVLRDGSHTAIRELANEIGASQGAEIGRMRRILREL
ncbi:DUF305 domain-containing protein [Thermoactinospora rubra]|uniref:DUF305 domain-containing protein n=1 Tax=Thermoactinospora rubra TaxID=1088767 RepID=UPI00117F09F0|nr:DUF305 domain-containing protein [Thermoactinospora rubra]